MCRRFFLAVLLLPFFAFAENDPQLTSILRRLELINMTLSGIIDPDYGVVYSYPLYYQEGMEDLGQRMAQGFDDVVTALQSEQLQANWAELHETLNNIDYNTSNGDWLLAVKAILESMSSDMDAYYISLNNLDNTTSGNTYGNGMWHSHLDDSQISDIHATLENAIQEVVDAMGPGYDMMTQATQETRLEVKEALARLAEKVNLLVLDLHELIEPVQSLDDEVQDQTLLLTDSRNDLHSLLLAFSNSTNIEVVEGFNQHAGVTNAPTVGQLNGQFQRTENLASTNETATRSELSDYESSSSYELPVLDFNSMIPGEITPLRAFEPNFDNTPSLADSYTIPILSSPLQAGSVTIDAFSLDLATGSAYDNVMRPFKETIGPITEQIWNLIFAISVLLLAKYEWKAYMSGVGPSVAAHEQQERQDYDGYIF